MNRRELRPRPGKGKAIQSFSEDERMSESRSRSDSGSSYNPLEENLERSRKRAKHLTQFRETNAAILAERNVRSRAEAAGWREEEHLIRRGVTAGEFLAECEAHRSHLSVGPSTLRGQQTDPAIQSDSDNGTLALWGDQSPPPSYRTKSSSTRYGSGSNISDLYPHLAEISLDSHLQLLKRQEQEYKETGRDFKRLQETVQQGNPITEEHLESFHNLAEEISKQASYLSILINNVLGPLEARKKEYEREISKAKNEINRMRQQTLSSKNALKKWQNPQEQLKNSLERLAQAQEELDSLSEQINGYYQRLAELMVDITAAGGTDDRESQKPDPSGSKRGRTEAPEQDEEARIKSLCTTILHHIHTQPGERLTGLDLKDERYCHQVIQQLKSLQQHRSIYSDDTFKRALYLMKQRKEWIRYKSKLAKKGTTFYNLLIARKNFVYLLGFESLVLLHTRFLFYELLYPFLLHKLYFFHKSF